MNEPLGMMSKMWNICICCFIRRMKFFGLYSDSDYLISTHTQIIYFGRKILFCLGALSGEPEHLIKCVQKCCPPTARFTATNVATVSQELNLQVATFPQQHPPFFKLLALLWANGGHFLRESLYQLLGLFPTLDYTSFCVKKRLGCVWLSVCSR